MRRILLLLLPASMLAIGTAASNPAPTPESLVRIARAQTTIPTEWDGIWDTVDTVYTCQGVFSSTNSGGQDTLCGGSEYTASSGGIVFVCTGTADATTIDATCTGSGEVFPGCSGDYNVVTHGTRTNNTYFIVSTINVSYTGVLCVGLPTCLQVNNHGTRTGPTMAGDCAVTPTKRSAWGTLKVLYR